MPIRRSSFTLFFPLLFSTALSLVGVLAPSAASAAIDVETGAAANADGDRRSRPANPPTGCTRQDWLAAKCSQYPYPQNQNPPVQPSPPDRPYGDRYRRPVVIIPAAAPVDDTPLTDDWEGCRRGKLRQLAATGNGDLTSAKQLEEWLWKNCRSYSEDLRQLEQDAM